MSTEAIADDFDRWFELVDRATQGNPIVLVSDTYRIELKREGPFACGIFRDRKAKLEYTAVSSLIQLTDHLVETYDLDTFTEQKSRSIKK